MKNVSAVDHGQIGSSQGKMGKSFSFTLYIKCIFLMLLLIIVLLAVVQSRYVQGQATAQNHLHSMSHPNRYSGGPKYRGKDKVLEPQVVTLDKRIGTNLYISELFWLFA